MEFRTGRWLYAVVSVPLTTELLEGKWPRTPREVIPIAGLSLLLFLLVMQIRRYERSLVRLTETDALTGLFNRRRFDVDLRRERDRARRLHTGFALLMIDIDRFKHLNDSYGHSEGDQALRDLSRRLSLPARDGVDSVYRIGGDEFAVILPAKSAEAAADAAARWQSLEPELATFLKEHGAGLSLGFGVFDGAETVEELITRADDSMYGRKASSRRSG